MPSSISQILRFRTARFEKNDVPKDVERNSPRVRILATATRHPRDGTVNNISIDMLNVEETMLKLDIVEALLLSSCADIAGPTSDLVTIYHTLIQLDTARNEYLFQARRDTIGSTAFFRRVDKVLADFEDYIIALGRNIFLIARDGNGACIIRQIVEIAEMSRDDSDSVADINAVLSNAENAQGFALKYIQLKFCRGLITAIKDRILLDPSTVIGFSTSLSRISQDLHFIQSDITHFFPSHWNIWALCVDGYKHFLVEFLDSCPDPCVVIEVHSWLQQHKAELCIPAARVNLRITRDIEQAIISAYTSPMILKLDEWSANLMKEEIATFTTRIRQPELDHTGCYTLHGPEILFQMTNQQISVAMLSGLSGVVAAIISGTSRILLDVQRAWIGVIDTECQRHLEKPEKAPGGLVEYIIAVANDQMKSSDYIEALRNRLQHHSELHEDMEAVDGYFRCTTEGYLDIASRCVQILIDIMFNDLETPVHQLFTRAWYNGTTGIFVGTIRDYMSDCLSYLNPVLLQLHIESIADTFLVAYLNALVLTPKLKIPSALLRIQEDMHEMQSCLASFKPGINLESQFEIVDRVLGMLSVSKELIFLEYWRFSKGYGPNLDFVEALIRMRNDLTWSDAKYIIRGIKRKIQNERLAER